MDKHYLLSGKENLFLSQYFNFLESKLSLLIINFILLRRSLGRHIDGQERSQGNFIFFNPPPFTYAYEKIKSKVESFKKLT